MECHECNKEIKEKAICWDCFNRLICDNIHKQWDISKLERVKRLVDEIIEVVKKEPKANPYSEKDYTYLFDEEEES